MVEHCLVLAQYSIPLGLLYAAIFGLQSWGDFACVTLAALALGAIVPSSSHAACLVRLFSGSFVADVRKRPLRPLIIFDRELDPACMPVRECLSVLDIAAYVYPLPLLRPKQAILAAPLESRFLTQILARSPTQSAMLPFLEDPNTNIVLQGDTDEILLYLYTTYGRKGGHRNMGPPLAAPGGLKPLAQLACLLRSFQPYGLVAQPSIYNRRPLRLMAYEGCADSKAVRERLCSLQLNYEYVTCAQGGTGRVQLIHQVGRLVTPTLYDPSTSQLVEGVRACLAYLDEMYDCSQVLLSAIHRAQTHAKIFPEEIAAQPEPIEEVTGNANFSEVRDASDEDEG